MVSPADRGYDLVVTIKGRAGAGKTVLMDRLMLTLTTPPARGHCLFNIDFEDEKHVICGYAEEGATKNVLIRTKEN